MRTLKNIAVTMVLFVIASTLSAGAQQKPNAPTRVIEDPNRVFVVVEKAPTFPGGTKALGTYLSKNIKYPAIDRNNNIQGKVTVSFIVEPDGRLTDVNALRGPSATLQAEAVRVIKLSPKWIAGAQGGKRVRVKYAIPVNFTLEGEGVSNTKPPKPIAPVAKNQKKENVYRMVEKSPEFPGGTKAFLQFLAKNVRYPVVDKDNNLQGKVFVSFVVERDGKLTDVSAVRGPSETLNAEAVRVVASSPAWKPGLQGGKPVRVQYTVPINFTLGS